MSSTLPKDGEKVTPPAWDPYPSPPSSGRGAVLLPSGDKRSLTRLTADQCEEDEQGHQAKRARPQQARSALLTPPSTRGRRMADRLTMLDRESGSYLPSSSRRPCGGREARFETWTDEDSQLDTPSAQKQRRLQHKLRTEPYPIRDTAHNPFIEGGPADMGITGPQPYRAPARSAAMHRHESGNMLYVLYVTPLTQSRTACDAPGLRYIVFNRSGAIALPLEAAPAFPTACEQNGLRYASAQRFVRRRRSASLDKPAPAWFIFPGA